MSNLRTAAQQALDYWEQVAWGDAVMADKMDALRAALAQQAEPVEPVAWMFELARNFNLEGYGGWEKRITEYRPITPEGSVRNVTPLYTSPPKRKPLTEEEIDRIRADCVFTPHEYRDRAYGWALHFARAVERAHGITGDNTQPTASMDEITRLRAERDALAERLREVRALLADTIDAHRQKVVMNAWAEQRLARHGIPMPEGDPK